MLAGARRRGFRLCGKSCAKVLVTLALTLKGVTMERINIKTALRAFDRIREEGVDRSGEHHLNGVAAGSDFDGYTITLHDDYVTLQIYFHNKFKLDFVNRRHLDVFIERIENIAKRKKKIE
jgi:hypothetical protein